MKKIFVLILTAVLFAVCGYWYVLVQKEQKELTVKTLSLVFEPSLEERVAQKKEQESKAVRKENRININCFVWGPIKEKSLATVQEQLKKIYLADIAVIQDRFLPEKYIAYIGPFTSQTAALAFTKQFRQQGYRKVRPILRGALSFGVEIESFNTLKEARAFMTGPKAPTVDGVKITNRLGEPSGEVDLVFPDVTDAQRLALFRLWQRSPSSTDLKNCGGSK